MVSEISQSDLRHAADLLRRGRLVAFPTETVYGLGANALDAAAVARIFEAKGRPHTSPLIVHVASVADVTGVVSEWPAVAQTLAEKFWPGPLTLVLPKRAAVPSIVTAGLPTVGVRMPAHPVALALLRECGLPLAAPSANRFTQLSPTTAEHVRRSLADRVDFILDGGPCTVGIESTVLSLVTPEPTILRPGGISREQLEKVIGRVTLATTPAEGAHASPGMHEKHYSPRTRLLLVSDGSVLPNGRGVYLQISRELNGNVSQVVLMPSDPRMYATDLYRTLHDLDQLSLDWIAVEQPPSTPEWEAVLDRLRRAATGDIYLSEIVFRYTARMSCRELAALRAEAKELNRLLIHQRAVARSMAHMERGTHPPGKSDYEPLIKRKLERLAETIQKHKAEHGCED